MSPREETPPVLRRLLGGTLVATCLLSCGAAGVLLWNPALYLDERDLGRWLPIAERFNFLGQVFANARYAAVLWWLLAVAVILAAFSSGAFRLASDGAGPDSRDEPNSEPGAPPARRMWRALGWSGLGLAAAAQLFLWVRLHEKDYQPWLFYLWLAGLLAFAVAFARLDRRSKRSARWPFSAGEMAFLLVCGVAFTAYCCRDLTSWRYSFMGDELGFWTFAGRLAHGYTHNYFSSFEGVAGYHPVLCSVYQSLFLRLLGPNNFAWRFSSVIAAALAIPFLYLFLRELIGPTAAVAGSLLLGANNYLITYAHFGLNNVQVLAPTLAALALLLWGCRQQSWLLLYGCGVMAGLGFYTFFSSRLAIAFVTLAFLLLPMPVASGRRLRWFGVVVLGFGLTMIPLIAVPEHFVAAMLRQSAMGTTAAESPSGLLANLWISLTGPAARVKWEYCLIDPLYSIRSGRLMYGSWVDSFVGAFFFLGLVWAALRWPRHRALLWLLLCYLGSVIAVAILSQYAAPPDTRMLFLVPLYISFAVLGVEVLRAELVLNRLLPRRASALLYVPLVLVSMAVNYQRNVDTTPGRYAIHPYAQVVHVAQSLPANTHVYFVAPPPYWVDILKEVASMYHFDQRFEIVRTPEVDDGQRQFERPAVFTFADIFPEKMDDTIAALRRRYPDCRLEDFDRLQAIEVPADTGTDGSPPS